MDATYILRVDEIELESDAYIVYGVDCCIFSTGFTRSISNIITNKARLNHWVLLMNRLQLSPVHFRDVIEDILVEDSL